MLWNAAAGSFLNRPLSHGIRRDSSPKVRAKVKRSAAAKILIHSISHAVRVTASSERKPSLRQEVILDYSLSQPVRLTALSKREPCCGTLRQGVF